MALIGSNPPPSAPKKQGTGFTNLNRVLGANKSNKLGQAVGGGLSQQVGQAKEGIQTGLSSFQTEAQKNNIATDENKEKAQTILNDPTQATDQDVNQFSTFRSGRYAGPSDLQNKNQLQNQAAQATTLGGMAGSAEGRQALLQRFVGGAGYNQGQQRLDSLLLGQNKAPELNSAVRDAKGLNQQLNTATGAAQAQAKQIAGGNQQFATDVTNQATTSRQNVDNDVTNALSGLKTTEENRSKIFDTIKASLADPSIDYSNDQSVLDAVNKAIGTASANGVMSADDVKRVQEIYQKLRTPVDQMVTQTTQGDTGGYVGYGLKTPGTTATWNAGQKFSQLKLNELLNNSFQSTGAENLTKAGIISEADRAKANALSRLLGQQQEYTGDEARFKSGAAQFDLNKAYKAADEDIARLKGEDPTVLPDNYYEVPALEKWRRTLAPSTDEALGDIGQDASGVFASNATAGDRLGSAAKLMADPYRMVAGQAANIGKIGLDSTEQGLNKLFSGDIIGGGGQILFDQPHKMLDAASDTANKTVQAVSNIPIAGLAIKPIAMVTAPIAKAAQSVVNAVNPFCFGKGTAILMADGSTKAVEDLTLLDETFGGGAVLGLGVSLTPETYDYNGVIVTGNHAIFENGSWIRAQDSSYSKLIPGVAAVYPIVTEKHVLVSGEQVFSDLSEHDLGHSVSDADRLILLNSDTERNSQLSSLVTSLKEYNEFNRHVS